MKLIKALLKAYVITFATLFTIGFIYGAIQETIRQLATPKGITPRQFARMKRNIRKYTTDYTSHIK